MWTNLRAASSNIASKPTICCLSSFKACYCACRRRRERIRIFSHLISVPYVNLCCHSVLEEVGKDPKTDLAEGGVQVQREGGIGMIQ